MNEQQNYSAIAKLSSAFSPGAPINSLDLFAGRQPQINNVIAAVSQRGQHVIIFGERGVGKTSLATIISEIIGQEKTNSDRPEFVFNPGAINCDKGDTFETIWLKIFREMRFTTSHQTIGFQEAKTLSQTNLNEVLSQIAISNKVSPDDIRLVLKLAGKSIIIIDEIDRIEDKQTTTLIADTIKTLSDHSIDSTIILLGVSDSVDELISEHQSVERALTQIHMPRMSREESFEILDKGFAQVKMRIREDAKHRIALLSLGLPHYTHLLGQHAGLDAIQKQQSAVTLANVNAAIKPAVEKAQQSIKKSYHTAISSPRKDTLHSRVLLACALAPADDLGYFAASDIRETLSTIRGKPMEIPSFSQHLNDFCSPKRGNVLQKIGTARKFRFRFSNPLLQPFVVINGIEKNLLPQELLQEAKLANLHA